MRKLALCLLAAAFAAVLAAIVRGPAPEASVASSHREAPAIADDPTADNTDLYAFRSPDSPDTITIISNVIPGEDPAAGPNWYRFAAWPTARYNVYIDRDGDAKPDVTYRFRFRNREGTAFLGNTVQDYDVTRISGSQSQVVARGATPPNNIGPKSTPSYRSLAAAGVLQMDGGGLVFAGQREDGFFGDIGSVFDLINFRKGTGNMGGGKDFFAGYAVHALALQIPISQLDDADHTIGVWTGVDRQTVRVQTVRTKKGRKTVVTRPFVQVSRLGNPLVNEVVIPTSRKDEWNRDTPAQESKYAGFYTQPLLAAVINQLFPGVVNAPERDRDDLAAVLLTGVPGLNNTGSTQADMLRLNMSIPPTASPNRLGVLAGDTAGWPNGRRLEDDVIDIAVRAVAGKLKGNPVADVLGDGVDANDVPNLPVFPYEADPFSGFDNTKGRQKP
ncbi:MAG TPA: DUF4331 domain-containing protein [Gaiellaceae bacterium]|jgi:hypothetical protein|nr:DUF4331 domain-containing protein [Gaiellaceae bacterium]